MCLPDVMLNLLRLEYQHTMLYGTDGMLVRSSMLPHSTMRIYQQCTRSTGALIQANASFRLWRHDLAAHHPCCRSGADQGGVYLAFHRLVCTGELPSILKLSIYFSIMLVVPQVGALVLLLAPKV